MKKNNEFLEIEYTEKDLDYIDELMSYMNSNLKEIINFFELYDFGEKVNIKLSSKLDTFRSSCLDIWNNNGNIPDWMCGLSFYKDNKYSIYVPCLEEYKKTDGHSNDSLNDLKLLLMHEFVHICHRKYNNNIKLLPWLSEGLATTISHQYDNYELSFDATLDQMIKGGTPYKNYHTMFLYVLNKYGRNYILQLLNDKDYLYKITPKLYEEVVSYYCKK